MSTITSPRIDKPAVSADLPHARRGLEYFYMREGLTDLDGDAIDDLNALGEEHWRTLDRIVRLGTDGSGRDGMLLGRIYLGMVRKTGVALVAVDDGASFQQVRDFYGLVAQAWAGRNLTAQMRGATASARLSTLADLLKAQVTARVGAAGTPSITPEDVLAVRGQVLRDAGLTFRDVYEHAEVMDLDADVQGVRPTAPGEVRSGAVVSESDAPARLKVTDPETAAALGVPLDTFGGSDVVWSAEEAERRLRGAVQRRGTDESVVQQIYTGLHPRDEEAMSILWVRRRHPRDNEAAIIARAQDALRRDRDVRATFDGDPATLTFGQACAIVTRKEVLDDVGRGSRDGFVLRALLAADNGARVLRLHQRLGLYAGGGDWGKDTGAILRLMQSASTQELEDASAAMLADPLLNKDLERFLKDVLDDREERLGLFLRTAPREGGRVSDDALLEFEIRDAFRDGATMEEKVFVLRSLDRMSQADAARFVGVIGEDRLRGGWAERLALRAQGLAIEPGMTPEQIRAVERRRADDAALALSLRAQGLTNDSDVAASLAYVQSTGAARSPGRITLGDIELAYGRRFVGSSAVESMAAFRNLAVGRLIMGGHALDSTEAYVARLEDLDRGVLGFFRDKPTALYGILEEVAAMPGTAAQRAERMAELEALYDTRHGEGALRRMAGAFSEGFTLPGGQRMPSRAERLLDQGFLTPGEQVVYALHEPRLRSALHNDDLRDLNEVLTGPAVVKLAALLDYARLTGHEFVPFPAEGGEVQNPLHDALAARAERDGNFAAYNLMANAQILPHEGPALALELELLLGNLQHPELRELMPQGGSAEAMRRLFGDTRPGTEGVQQQGLADYQALIAGLPGTPSERRQALAERVRVDERALFADAEDIAEVVRKQGVLGLRSFIDSTFSPRSEAVEQGLNDLLVHLDALQESYRIHGYLPDREVQAVRFAFCNFLADCQGAEQFSDKNFGRVFTGGLTLALGATALLAGPASATLYAAVGGGTGLGVDLVMGEGNAVGNTARGVIAGLSTWLGGQVMGMAGPDADSMMTTLYGAASGFTIASTNQLFASLIDPRTHRYGLRDGLTSSVEQSLSRGVQGAVMGAIAARAAYEIRRRAGLDERAPAPEDSGEPPGTGRDDTPTGQPPPGGDTDPPPPGTGRGSRQSSVLSDDDVPGTGRPGEPTGPSPAQTTSVLAGLDVTGGAVTTAVLFWGADEVMRIAQRTGAVPTDAAMWSRMHAVAREQIVPRMSAEERERSQLVMRAEPPRTDSERLAFLLELQSVTAPREALATEQVANEDDPAAQAMADGLVPRVRITGEGRLARPAPIQIGPIPEATPIVTRNAGGPEAQVTRTAGAPDDVVTRTAGAPGDVIVERTAGAPGDDSVVRTEGAPQTPPSVTELPPTGRRQFTDADRREFLRPFMSELPTGHAGLDAATREVQTMFEVMGLYGSVLPVTPKPTVDGLPGRYSNQAKREVERILTALGITDARERARFIVYASSTDNAARFREAFHIVGGVIAPGFPPSRSQPAIAAFVEGFRTWSTAQGTADVAGGGRVTVTVGASLPMTGSAAEYDLLVTNTMSAFRTKPSPAARREMERLAEVFGVTLRRGGEVLAVADAAAFTAAILESLRAANQRFRARERQGDLVDEHLSTMARLIARAAMGQH